MKDLSRAYVDELKTQPLRGASSSIPNTMSSPTLATTRAGASKDDC
jgi:hypothetical protein